MLLSGELPTVSGHKCWHEEQEEKPNSVSRFWINTADPSYKPLTTLCMKMCFCFFTPTILLSVPNNMHVLLAFQSTTNASRTNIAVMRTLCVSTPWEVITVSASRAILEMGPCAKVRDCHGNRVAFGHVPSHWQKRMPSVDLEYEFGPDLFHGDGSVGKGWVSPESFSVNANAIALCNIQRMSVGTQIQPFRKPPFCFPTAPLKMLPCLLEIVFLQRFHRAVKKSCHCFCRFQPSAKTAVETGAPASLPTCVPVHKASRGRAVKPVRNPLICMLHESDICA